MIAKRIESAPRDGTIIFVTDLQSFARTYWEIEHGGRWVYHVEGGIPTRLGFEPTHWAHGIAELRELVDSYQ